MNLFMLKNIHIQVAPDYKSHLWANFVKKKREIKYGTQEPALFCNFRAIIPLPEVYFIILYL